jgi:hypothetical protein
MAGASDYLSPGDYNKQEMSNINECGDYLFSIASPRVFTKSGYPYRAENFSELFRMVDSVNFSRAEAYLATLGSLSASEFALFKRIATAAAEVSADLYGKRVIARRGILAAMNMFRQIRAIGPDLSGTVLEVGGGNGYLGALLALHGYRYMLTDVTQSLYLYQSHLLQKLCGDDFFEAALVDPKSVSIDDMLRDHRVVHVPWWQYYTWFEAPPASGIDLVVSNRALLEMHDAARFYTIKLCRQLLNQSSNGRFFIFDDWGGSEMSAPAYGTWQFIDAGYKLCHVTGALKAFAIDARISGLQYVDLPRQLNYRTYYPQRGRFDAPDVFSSYEPRTINNPRIARAISRFEATRQKEPQVDLGGIDDFLRGELGFEQMTNVDERFSNYSLAR